ncbi:MULTISPECIES: acyl carrier protein [Streptomyces]|uniref:acyl carrier protein n=1 Tax=Streptomyces TaxID=1883 RepID=UPI0005BA5F06|nr:MULTISPECIES: acyl carrier protein [Streptomyces]MDP9949220.1 act minimal PKS acyl carrier protein [Streptomyces sp. DSM 41269]
MQQLDLPTLISLLRTSGGSDTHDLNGDVLDVAFADLGYDSLCLLQVTGVIERDAGVALDEQVLEEAETPRQYIAAVNRVLSPQATA